MYIDYDYIPLNRMLPAWFELFCQFIVLWMNLCEDIDCDFILVFKRKPCTNKRRRDQSRGEGSIKHF